MKIVLGVLIGILWLFTIGLAIMAMTGAGSYWSFLILFVLVLFSSIDWWRLDR
ncbi:hypothetical protein [Levilactobacillus cerevisiae]|uniref:hypothetical protein n=1 Tax=Levilactobacillus cerevisiae TaxID=1704076 RepID=UPI0013DE2646|nr:hypothetical protein [Levilactobacillus cerevisiae]